GLGTSARSNDFTVHVEAMSPPNNINLTDFFHLLNRPTLFRAAVRPRPPPWPDPRRHAAELPPRPAWLPRTVPGGAVSRSEAPSCTNRDASGTRSWPSLRPA